MIIAVDFDGTLFEEGGYPGVGSPILANIELVKHMSSRGHRIILWTCRQGESLDNALKACNEYGLQFVAVNENDPENSWPDPMSNKVYADLYLDDRAVRLSKDRGSMSLWRL